MIATNPIPDVCNYAQCGEKCAPTPEQAAAGLVPLSTIPAQRWNSLWNAANQSVNCLKSAAGALIDEINSVLTATGITPDPTRTDQLYQAIDCIRVALGTDQVAGSVKSSSVAGQVSIDANGIMTANCVGNATQLTTSCKELTGAVNELKTTYDNAFTQVWGNAAWITDCRADVCHSSNELTYGGGTSALYGHVKLSDTYDSCVGNAASSVAASQLTLYCLTQAVENMSGLSNCAACPVNQYAQTGTAGVSPQAARSDHVHYLYTDTYFPYTSAKRVKYSTPISFVDNYNMAPFVSIFTSFGMGSIYPLVGFLWQCYSSGWFQTIYCPVDYFKGYFRGCNINDHLRDWLMVGCRFSLPDGSCVCTSQTYTCWCTTLQNWGIDVACALDQHCILSYFDSSADYGAYNASLMGSRYVTYSSQSDFLNRSDNMNCAVTTAAMVDSDHLHLLTTVFQVHLHTGFTAMTQRAHALVLMENDARVPGPSTCQSIIDRNIWGQEGCLYLQSMGLWYQYVYPGTTRYDMQSSLRAVQDVNCLLQSSYHGAYYRCTLSHITYGITSNCVNIGVKNQTLYMRNA